MPTRIYTIAQGNPTVAGQTLTLLGTGTAGTPGAKHVLTHPTAGLAPLTYISNPDRILNLDNDVLVSPLITTALTLADRKVFRFEGFLADTIVTEIWIAGGTKMAMLAAQARLLYEYWINVPDFDPVSPVYVQYQPRSRNAKTYNVEIVSLSIGSGGGGGGDTTRQFDFTEIIPPGGVKDGGDTLEPLENLDDSQSGLVDRTVVLQMKIINEV